MVFVEWEKQGICKWWMLQRCGRADSCRLAHPTDWRWRWNEETVRQQQLEQEFGIAPLENPRRPRGESGEASATAGDRDENCLVRKGRPGCGEFEAREDAPASLDCSAMARSENANTVPLGRPNRLADGSNKAAAPGPAGVWKRTDGDTTHSNPPPVNEHHRKDNFWERRAARKEAECGKTHTTKGKTKKRRHVVEASSQPPDRRPHPHRQAQPSHDVGPAHHTRDTISTAALNPDLQHFRPFPFPPAPPPSPPPGAAATMGTKRMSNGEAKHPPRSEIRVSARYLTQAFIDKKLQPPWSEVLGSVQERSMYEAREDSVRLQGVTWLDHVRRALELPVRTFATACVYYHLVRLAHPGLLHGSDPNVQATVADACAASLLTACKVEDTLKKSRDVLAAAYNLKAPAQEQLGTDDPVFDGPVKHVIVLERMVLEAGGFDFRSKQPHSLMVRIIKFLSLPEGNEEERKTVSKTAFTILTDMYRTFAPLKQTAAAMALASLELAAHLYATTTSNNTSAVRDALQAYDVSFFSLSREEIMETLLDLLDLYTHHTNGTAIGPIYSLDDFLRIRLAMNKECAESNLPRYTTKSPDAAAPPANGSTSRVANGHPTPVSPPSPDPQSQFHNTNNAGLQPRSNNPEDQQQQIQQQQPGQQQQQQQQQQPVQTTRFMLNPQRAADEHAIVQTFFAEEWEEYEEEIEVPIPQPTPHNHAHSSHHPRSHLHPRAREPPSGPAAAGSGGGGAGAAGSPLYPPRARDERERERERLRDREREVQRELRERERERERERDRDRERERERDHRRYDDRERGRYEDKRDRRYEDDRRRRDDRR